MKNYDHISQMLQIGKVSQEIIRDNTDLVQETLNAIYDDIIPDKLLV